jgi:hypothetical protein
MGLHKDYTGPIEIKTINLLKDKTETFFNWNNQSHTSNYSMPQRYLYEPNSAIMKSGDGGAIQTNFKNILIYTLRPLSFPGRVLRLKLHSYSKQELKRYLQNKKQTSQLEIFQTP